MTQEQKRIAIAEAFGMTGWEEARALPDYFNDLNAVHELELILTDEEHLTFRKKLWDIAITLGHDDVWDRHFISPTAAQRAEALGKTLNLW